MCSQADKIVGDPRWPKHFVLLWPFRECGKLEGEIRTVDKKKGRKVMLSMLLPHIHLYSYIFGVLQNTVIPSGAAFSRQLMQQARGAEIEMKH